MERKLRFGDLVGNSGRPRVVTLWTEPNKDPALALAIKANRILTVVRKPGRPDFGLIDLRIHPGAAYLVFPRPRLRRGALRVVGINYQLIEEADFSLTATPRSARAD